MNKEDHALLMRLLRGLGWIVAFLLATALGAFTGCIGAGAIGSLVDSHSPNYGKGIEGAGMTLLLGFCGTVIGGLATAAIFQHYVRKGIKQRRKKSGAPTEKE